MRGELEADIIRESLKDVNYLILVARTADKYDFERTLNDRESFYGQLHTNLTYESFRTVYLTLIFENLNGDRFESAKELLRRMEGSSVYALMRNGLPHIVRARALEEGLIPDTLLVALEFDN